MEKMTAKERETLKDLQAKYKRVQRAEEEFLRDADENRDMLLARWNIQDSLQEIATRIGTNTKTLSEWLLSKQHAEAFKNYHQQEAKSNSN